MGVDDGCCCGGEQGLRNFGVFAVGISLRKTTRKHTIKRMRISIRIVMDLQVDDEEEDDDDDIFLIFK